jgi:hypothetical protein
MVERVKQKGQLKPETQSVNAAPVLARMLRANPKIAE